MDAKTVKAQTEELLEVVELATKKCGGDFSALSEHDVLMLKFARQYFTKL